jgi:hypothetical protein
MREIAFISVTEIFSSHALASNLCSECGEHVGYVLYNVFTLPSNRHVYVISNVGSEIWEVHNLSKILYWHAERMVEMRITYKISCQNTFREKATDET